MFKSLCNIYISWTRRIRLPTKYFFFQPRTTVLNKISISKYKKAQVSNFLKKLRLFNHGQNCFSKFFHFLP